VPTLFPLQVRTIDNVLASQIAGLFQNGAILQLPLTSQYFVDANRTDTYVEDGNLLTPFKTLAAAYSAAKIGATSTNPKYINLLSSITENLTMDTGYVGIQGFTNSGVRAPLYLNGTITVAPTSGTINDNFLGITNLAILKPEVSSGNCINVAGGSTPCRVFLESVWFQNGSTNSFGLTVDNTGASTSVSGQLCQFSPFATGGGISVVNGTCNMVDCDSTGGSATCVDMFRVASGGRLNFSRCQLEGNATQIVNCTGGDYGVSGFNLSLAQTLLTNNRSTGHGITLASACLVSIGTCGFNVLTGSGAKAINGVASANLATLPYSLVLFDNVNFLNATGVLVRNTTVTTNKVAYSVMS